VHYYYYYHYLCILCGVAGILCLGQDYVFHGRYNTGAMRIIYIYFHRHNIIVYNLTFDRGIGITLKLLLYTGGSSFYRSPKLWGANVLARRSWFVYYDASPTFGCVGLYYTVNNFLVFLARYLSQNIISSGVAVYYLFFYDERLSSLSNIKIN